VNTWKKVGSRPANLVKPALFLDRDGVIIEERHHLSDPAGVSICAGVSALLKHAIECSWAIVIITNQSGIGRGFFEWGDFERVVERMLELLGGDIHIDAIYANSLVEQASAPGWRKPAPGMLLEAARDLNLSLSSSIVVGDRLSDLQAGRQAGLKTLVHLKTGHGEAERERVKSFFSSCDPFTFAANPFELILLDDLEQFPARLLTHQTSDQGESF